jgi:hypothetical protein
VNYLKLQEISERKIRSELLQGYIGKKFKWSRVKTNYFLEKNNINSIEQLVNYHQFPQWENKMVRKTLEFSNYCGQKKEE